MKISSIYYSPHQVASFYSITRDTLLYYDKIGLFSPSKRKKNGYRCYSANQLNELDTILTLRDLGVSIPAIKEAIGNLDTPSFIALLDKEEESLRKKIDEYSMMLRTLDAVRSSMAEAKSAEKEKLFIAKMKSWPIIKMPIRNKDGVDTSDEAWEEAYRNLISKADGKAIVTIGSIVRLDEARETLGAVCREVYAMYSKESEEHVPGGRYACMFFSGSLSNLSSFYDKFFTALEDRGLQPSGDIFEELTVSSIVERNEDAHITKLMVAVL